MAKTTEYIFNNYDGGWPAYPEPGLAGSIEILDGLKWQMNFGFRKHLSGSFKEFPLVVEPITDTSCRVMALSTSNPEFRVCFDLPETSVQAFEEDLESRGYSRSAIKEAADKISERTASGQWWAGISEYKIGMGYHYAGARDKRETGTIYANAAGIEYKAFAGSKVKIPWSAIRGIEVSTQATRRVTAGRVVALGVFALAAKKGEIFTYVHITDQNSLWSFAIKSSQGAVINAWKPVLAEWNERVQDPKTDSVSHSENTSGMSVADELRKLAQLRDDGILTEEEFSTRKLKLLEG